MIRPQRPLTAFTQNRPNLRMETRINMETIVGGGPKKLLYTLKTLQKIGLRKGTKALTSRNTCKACGLGMGGQLGGMVNEKGEYPSVCNKSVQAQSTDLRPAIPLELFQHNLDDFKALSALEFGTLGRLGVPLLKARNHNKFEPISWSQALSTIAEKLKLTDPDRTFFYTSGRSSNEAGFVLQLFARVFGTNNINNCSYYCHQATSVGLHSTTGQSTATVSLAELAETDCVFVIGANPASNHPRFIHQLKGVRDRGGEVIVINPMKEPGLVRFSVPKSPGSLLFGGTEIASAYLQPKAGSDYFVLLGLGKALLEQGHIDHNFLSLHTDNHGSFLAHLTALNWRLIERETGLKKTTLADIARRYGRARRSVFAWGMGITHHLHGSRNVEAIAALALLRGMIGKPGAGLLPLRGHSNVQGIGTIGVKPELDPIIAKRMADHFNFTLPTQPGLDTLACVDAAHQGEIDFALIMGGNLLEATPDRTWAEAAMNKIKLKVFLTTTLNHGHVYGMDDQDAIILPVTARDEEWQPTTQESMFNYVRLSDGGISRVSGARPESNVICTIAQQVLGHRPVDFSALASHEAICTAVAAIVPGMQQVAAIHKTKKEFHIEGRLMQKPRFPTQSGRARFPEFELTRRAQATDAFTMMSIRSEGQFNSMIYENHDTYRGTKHRQIVFMNKSDITRLGLAAGMRVDVSSPAGELKGLELVAFDLPVENVALYYPESNVLVETKADPRSRTPGFKSQPVSIKPSAHRIV